MPNNDNEINVLPAKRDIQVNERYERAIRNDKRKNGSEEKEKSVDYYM